MSLVVTDTNWAVHEFADADLGDERRTTRLVELASALGQHPTAALPEACGTGSMLKAAYRFFHNDGIAPQDMLHSHVEATYTRLGAVPVVLAVQDTTEVNWTRHPATQGLGPLGHTACHGLLVHIPSDLVVDRWASDVAGSSVLHFPLLHVIWLCEPSHNKLNNINRLKFYHSIRGESAFYC